MRFIQIFAAAVLVPSVVLAQAPADEAAAPEREFKPEFGKVVVGDNIATIDLPDGFVYFQQADARYIVEQKWQNLPDEGTLGLIMNVPPDSEEGEEEAPSWGIVVSYDEMGHVNDDDAGDIKYDELLKGMQEDNAAANEERAKLGYPQFDIAGWAEAPHYDAAARKLYWAVALKSPGEEEQSLNYDIRILGRKGALVLGAVSGLDQLKQVADGSKIILEKTEFTAGNRYADFDSNVDKVAAVGIGGLIAGKVLLKGGIIAALLKFAGAFIKPLIALLAVAGAGLAKLFGRKKDESQAEPGPNPEV